MTRLMLQAKIFELFRLLLELEKHTQAVNCTLAYSTICELWMEVHGLKSTIYYKGLKP